MNDLSLDSIRRSGVRMLGGLSVAVALATVAGAAIAGSATPSLVVLALLIPLYPVLLALRGQADATARIVVSVTLVAQPALTLFALKGHPWQVDIHMIFFASLAATAILCDWRAILTGAAVVAVHHLLLGMVVPDWVFLNGGGLGRILMHAVVLIAETMALVILARSVVALLDALDAESKQRARAEAQAEAERAAHEAELAAVLATVGQGLNGLAQGDLGQRLHGLPPAYAAMARDFDAAVESLNALIAAVTASASALRGTASQILDASDDLARRTQATGASVDETTQAVARVGGQMGKSADGAEEAVASADAAITTVRESRIVADEVARAMDVVSESAKGIDDVIEGLDKIAFQTRVLAMNAAVEAGRAGEAGRGFAVVADLVSALAMRAEEEAKRAREQLGVTQTEIGTAAGSVGRMDGSLASIAERVAEVHARLAMIATESRAQAQDIGQIDQAISVIDGASQQNAAMVEQTSAAVRSLTQEVERLVARTLRFRIVAEDEPVQEPIAVARRSGVSVH